MVWGQAAHCNEPQAEKTYTAAVISVAMYGWFKKKWSINKSL